MKRSAILCTLLALLSSAALAVEQGISKSVVKITTTTTAGGKIYIESATGWAWQKPTTVITALHTVAGKTIIEVRNHQGNTTRAQIIKVVKKGDLALLQLDKDLGLVPLKTGSADHNSRETFQVVGYPHNIPTMVADEIKFSTSFSGRPTLNHLIKGTQLETILRNQGYPVPETYIFRLSSTIQPGHSGAPIVRENGVVIGMADGGLKKGTARINWAIPAQQYVTQLSNSLETIPRTNSRQSDLFSAKTYISSVGAEIPVAADTESVSDPSGQITVHKVWNASLQDIYFTLEEDEQNDILEIFEDLSEDEAVYLFANLHYDIYEDYNTGVTFAVPEGAEVIYENGAFVVSLGLFEYAFIPRNTNTFDEAMQLVQLFAGNMLTLYPDAQLYDEDDEDGDYNEQWYNLAKLRVIQEEGELKFYAVGGEALGENAALVAFISPLPEALSPEELVRFLSFVVGLEIISFASY
jgi:S1-C subfamily serine protease